MRPPVCSVRYASELAYRTLASCTQEQVLGKGNMINEYKYITFCFLSESLVAISSVISIFWLKMKSLDILLLNAPFVLGK